MSLEDSFCLEQCLHEESDFSATEAVEIYCIGAGCDFFVLDKAGMMFAEMLRGQARVQMLFKQVRKHDLNSC